MRVVLRVSLPDRPGALSAVAAALSRAGADIACLDVIDRGDGIAVDDICVTTASPR
ncbi:MAG: ACT domain-containing protein [Actinobacteria bacterium]|nr:ACT domain-containing protein [Actinomycetota bacterium]